jgi:hypothetical protein
MQYAFIIPHTSNSIGYAIVYMLKRGLDVYIYPGLTVPTFNNVKFIPENKNIQLLKDVNETIFLTIQAMLTMRNFVKPPYYPINYIFDYFQHWDGNKVVKRLL